MTSYEYHTYTTIDSEEGITVNLVAVNINTGDVENLYMGHRDDLATMSHIVDGLIIKHHKLKGGK